MTAVAGTAKLKSAMVSRPSVGEKRDRHGGHVADHEAVANQERQRAADRAGTEIANLAVPPHARGGITSPTVVAATMIAIQNHLIGRLLLPGGSRPPCGPLEAMQATPGD